MTKHDVDLSAKRIWTQQTILKATGDKNFDTVEAYYRRLGPWNLLTTSYMQKKPITAGTPYEAVEKAIDVLAYGWEELKLTRNGEL